MKLTQCLKLLNLNGAVSVEEIKHAYRQMVQECHPDKNSGSSLSQQKFVQISTAYKTLMNATRAIQQGRKAGHCCMCGEFAEVHVGPDGLGRCLRCYFTPAGRRRLPLPILVISKCVGAVGLNVLALYLLIVSWATGTFGWALAALIAAFAGLALLAHTCLKIVYCTHPRELALYRMSASSSLIR